MKQLDLEAIEARCEAARHEVNRLCQGKTSWTMSIPVRDDDTDVMLTDAFRDIPVLLAEIKRLRDMMNKKQYLTTAALANIAWERSELLKRLAALKET